MLALGLATSSPALAAGERERGLRLAREGRCVPALAELGVARTADPRDAESSLVMGQCLIRLGRYSEAAAAIEVARAVNPVLDGVDVSLAIARYHMEEPDAARAALDRAEARNPERANVQLYRGLLLLERSENNAGIGALERARTLDPAYAEPVSSFYQGLALAELDEREEARVALQRVVDEWPGTPWADEAASTLKRLEGESERWWLSASIGAEYDSNVLLRGSGVDVPDDISDDADWRGVWTASGGVTLLDHPDWAIGVMGSYYGTKQDDVPEFDTHYPTASIWVDHPWSDSLVSRFRYEFGYAWVDEDPYLLANRFMTSLYQTWEEAGQTEVFARYERNDFRFDNQDVTDTNATPPGGCSDTSGAFCGPVGLDEASARDRDGHAFTVGVAHSIALEDIGPFPAPQPHGRYAFTRYDSDGEEYRHDQHAFSLGAEQALPFSFVLGLEASYAYRKYDNPTTFPEPDERGPSYTRASNDRKEHQWTGGASLSRALTDHLGVSLYWRFDDNDSNAPVFDYDRQVVGFKLTGSLGP